MDYSGTNLAVWSAIITCGIMAAAVLLCTFLRLRVHWVRRSLMPVAVLAGFLLMILRNLRLVYLDEDVLSIICYHAVAIGFIAMALRVPKDSERVHGVTGLRAGALAVATYMLQVLIGMGIAFILAYTVMPGLFESSGLLLAYGFGQGPGQANNVGAMFEAEGFEGGRSFGLALAAAGYLAAFVGGSLYLHRVKAKREAAAEIHDAVQPATVEMFQDECEAPPSDSVDRLTIQVSLIVGVYLLAYCLVRAVCDSAQLVLPESTMESLRATIWGFNFVAGVLTAVIVREVMARFRKKDPDHKQYRNNYLLTRISGASFDFMIVAGIAGINIQELEGLLIPFLLMAIVGGVGTYAFLRVVVHRVFPDFEDEAFLTMFGTWTGMISSGIILLREIDPDFRTPGANVIIVASAYAIVLGLPLLFITAGAPTDPLLWYGVVAAYFIVLMAIVLAGSRRKSRE